MRSHSSAWGYGLEVPQSKADTCCSSDSKCIENLDAGVGDTLNPDPSNLSCSVDCCRMRASQWQESVLTDSVPLAGTSDSYVFPSKHRGQTVGLSENGAVDPLTGFPKVSRTFSTALSESNSSPSAFPAGFHGRVHDPVSSSLAATPLAGARSPLTSA